jgi:hypothetical protein
MVNPVKKIDDAFFAERSTMNAETGCMEWTRTLNQGGYGTLKYKQKGRMAHRFMWEYKNGLIPDGLHVCHKCDNRKCINPDHLFLGTAKDNMQDMLAKNRANKAKGEDSFFAKLSSEQITAIRSDIRPQHVIAKDYGICQANVCLIKKRQTWAHVVDNVPDDKRINIKEFAALFELPYMPLKNRLHSKQMPMRRAINLTAEQAGSALRI